MKECALIYEAVCVVQNIAGIHLCLMYLQAVISTVLDWDLVMLLMGSLAVNYVTVLYISDLLCLSWTIVPDSHFCRR